jgi:hypothetical protein
MERNKIMKTFTTKPRHWISAFSLGVASIFLGAAPLAHAEQTSAIAAGCIQVTDENGICQYVICEIAGVPRFYPCEIE